jgi:hypothetical protein
MGKSKTQKTRPGYIPKEGWFIDIKYHGGDSRVYLDGKVVPNVTRFDVTCAAGEMTRAVIEIVNIPGRIKPASVTKERPHRKKEAEWGTS